MQRESGELIVGPREDVRLEMGDRLMLVGTRAGHRRSLDKGRGARARRDEDGGAMTLRTPICDLLGIDVPIGNAGMAMTAGPALAAAVADAGGLGSLGGIQGEGPEGTRQLIRRVRDLTSAPFSVNLWAHLLPTAPGFLDVCIEERVPSITLSFGDASPYVGRAHDAGILVVHQVQTVAGAEKAAAAGVDVIIAQGGEAGGHTGSVATMALVPQVVDVAGSIPVHRGGWHRRRARAGGGAGAGRAGA